MHDLGETRRLQEEEEMRGGDSAIYRQGVDRLVNDAAMIREELKSDD